jgi:hypothetical protein
MWRSSWWRCGGQCTEEEDTSGQIIDAVALVEVKNVFVCCRLAVARSNVAVARVGKGYVRDVDSLSGDIRGMVEAKDARDEFCGLVAVNTGVVDVIGGYEEQLCRAKVDNRFLEERQFDLFENCGLGSRAKDLRGEVLGVGLKGRVLGRD